MTVLSSSPWSSRNVAKACLLCGIPHKRHSFAVRTMLGWYRDGVDVQARLSWLSTYLGHRKPACTYWYLSAVPELLALAAEGRERNLAVQP